MIKCIIEECQNKAYRKNYCIKHFTRMQRHGDPYYQSRAENGEGYTDTKGYKILFVNGKYVKEHRIIMEQFLGRKLTKDENIHHINGNRSDNRIENLEIWNTQQPAGQRIKDKINFAKAIIKLYTNEEIYFIGEIPKN